MKIQICNALKANVASNDKAHIVCEATSTCNVNTEPWQNKTQPGRCIPDYSDWQKALFRFDGATPKIMWPKVEWDTATAIMTVYFVI